tara:strand:+ start:575 stop:781 length:207 start_codon:yes stop_codon:yes gene_type:complete
MKKYIKKYEEKFGYTPSVSELYNLHTKGLLSLSDNEENTLIKEYHSYLKQGYYKYHYGNEKQLTPKTK